MTKEELENEMLGDVVCSLENFQFAILYGPPASIGVGIWRAAGPAVLTVPCSAL